MSGREVPVRRSLVLRLFVLVAVVAVGSVAVTAWMTVRTTAVALHEDQGEAVRADAEIAGALTGYAATHRHWRAAGRLVQRLADDTGYRITLTGQDGAVLVDSSTSGAPLPQRPSSIVDPLDVGPAPSASPPQPCADRTCAAPASYDGPPPGDSPIDPRAVGPWRLTAQERRHSHALAERLASCLRTTTASTVTVTVSATGRSSLDAPDLLATPTRCPARDLAAPMPTEVRPLHRLQSVVDACLQRHDGPAVVLGPDLGWVQTTPRTPSGDRIVTSCLTAARREQLASYVATPATLYVSSPRQEASTFLDLSAGNRLRIAEVALLVLLASLGFAALAGRQLVGPLGLLAAAARRVREGDLSARADVRSRDEIGRVAEAFNTMAERREQAELLRKAMVSDVAHELRNPLSTIRGSLEAAQDGVVATDAALVASLLEETMLLQHVVEDLRDLAAADAGDLRLAVETVPVAALLRQVVAPHPEVTTSAPSDLTVRADPLRLRQMVGNLVANAVRHTPGAGTGAGTVSLEARVEGDSVVIEVGDTGDGIAAEDLPHVFERFWRADRSRARASGGSGLGLAIVKQLAEAHGGSVVASSEPGVGSVFTVRLPR